MVARRARVGTGAPAADWFDIDWRAGQARAARQGAAAVTRRSLRPGARRAASSGPPSTPTPARSACWYHEHRFPLAPRTYPAILGPPPAVRIARATRHALEQVAATPSRGLPVVAPDDGPRTGAGRARARAASARWRGSPPTSRRWRAWIVAPPGAGSRGAAVTGGCTGARAAALAPGVLARRRRRDQLPAVLQHQRPRRAARRAPRAVRPHPPAGLPADRQRAGSTGSASTTSTASSIRAPTASVLPKAPAAGTWIVVEKILAPDEPLRDWAVAGTTGYDVLNLLTRVLIDACRRRVARPHLRALHRRPCAVRQRSRTRPAST